jgi:hypothetical protein
MIRTFTRSKCAGVIAFLICAAGGVAYSQALNPRNTIRLDIGQSRTVTDQLRPLQRRRYKLAIREPGVLMLDHIKRSIRVAGTLYDAQGSPRNFDFREGFERGIDPGNYVLELVGASEGSRNTQGGFYSFRLRLRADLARDIPGTDTIRLRLGQAVVLQGSLPQKGRYKIVVEDPGGLLLLDEGKLDFTARVNLYESNGLLLRSDSTHAFFERKVDPGNYLLELANDERGTSRGHYFFRLSLQPRS